MRGFESAEVQAIARIGGGGAAVLEKRPDREGKVDLSGLTSDRQSSGIEILKPLVGHLRNYMESVRTAEELEYLSITRDPESSGERTAILQNIVDKMVDGTGKAARVVILRRGDGDAFVLPDGTICITQKLINELENLDEVAGVLAHEVGHIINETYVKPYSAVARIGHGWIHESAGDAIAPYLLEKADLNTNGFNWAIKRIAPNERGQIHQTGLARASQNVAMHMGVDFKTSSKKPVDIPANLKTDTVSRTNLEIAKEVINKEDIDSLKETLPMLHPRDLESAGEYVKGKIQYESETDERRNVLRTFNRYYIDALQEAGFTNNDINFFFIQGAEFFPYRYREFPLIKTPEDFLAVAREIYGEFAGRGTFRRMSKELFGNEHYDDDNSYASRMFNVLNRHMYNTDYDTEGVGIPVTHDSLFEFVDLMQNLPFEYQTKTLLWLKDADEGYRDRLITSLLTSYASMVYRDEVSEQLGGFVEEIAQRKIVIDSNWIKEQKHINDRVKEEFLKIFPAEVEKNIYEKIDAFALAIESAYRERDAGGVRKMLSDGFKDIQAELKEDGLEDAERLEFAQYFSEKVDGLHFVSGENLLERYAAPLSDELNDEVMRFSLKTLVGLTLFEQDGEEFYSYIKKTMDGANIDFDSLSWNQSLNLCSQLFDDDSAGPTAFPGRASGQGRVSLFSVGFVKITDFESFLTLPYIRKAIAKVDVPSCKNLEELNGALSDLQYKVFAGKVGQIFQDSLLPLMLGESLRKDFGTILRAGVSESDYAYLYTFINHFYPGGPQSNQFLIELNRRYLQSPEVHLRDKTKYLKDNFNRVGIEGMVMLAEQIDTLVDYKYFRGEMQGQIKKYLEGDQIAPVALALGDNASSRLVSRFGVLFETSKDSSEAKVSNTTRFAREWFSAAAGKYDKKAGKFEIGAGERGVFRTVADATAILQSLTSVQRFAIAQKALVDKDGALTTDANRRFLGSTLVQALGIKSTFISSAIKLGVETAPAEYVSLPASQMMGPLLFRGFDVDAIDLTKFKDEDLQEHGLDREKLDAIFHSDTRSVRLFGPQFRKDPFSKLIRTAEESDATYEEVTSILRELLLKNGNSHDRKKGEANIATEAVIKAVEASGALGVRSLQLARQLHRFSPQVDKRLAESFDSRPGLNKLLFWENLLKLSDQDEGGDIRAMVEEKMVTLDGFLGGGSLYTTFGATVSGDDVEKRKVVFKMLNPNPGLFIGTDERPAVAYQTATQVLDKIEEEGSIQDKNYANMGKVFVDLSQEWCLRDINDPSFEPDDDLFASSVEGFNADRGVEIFHQPARVINSYKFKSEDLVEGRTLNKVLSDPNVADEQKKEVVGLVKDFFAYQLQVPAGQTEAGEDFFLVHSDPHVGNYVVDFTESGEPKIGVIDRHMYLKLTQDEAHAFGNLLGGGSYRNFVPAAVDVVLDRNKYKANTREISKRRVMLGMAGEYVKQKGRSLAGGKWGVDNIALVRRLLGEFTDANLDVPLEHRLMLRNVEAFKQLERRYR